MNDLLPTFTGILLRATWLMMGALLVIGFMQRRRPLIASSLSTSTVAALLILPLAAAVLPGIPVPMGMLPRERAERPATTRGSSSEGITVATSVPGSASGQAPVRRAIRQDFAGSRVVDESRPPQSPEEPAAELDVRRHHRPSSAEVSPGPNTAAHPFAASWQVLLIAVYLFGVLALALRLAAGLWLIHRLRQAATVVSGGWVERLDGWRLRLGAMRPVEVRASDDVKVPMTFGWRTPAIVLPTSIVQALAPLQDAVLVHELAHIRRRDFAGLLLLQVAQAIYWCHPLIWILGLVGRNLQERACDDLCIHWMGARQTYRNALLAIAKQTICRPEVALGLAMAHPSRLSRRLEQIERSSGSDCCLARRAARLMAFGGMIMAASLVAPVHFVPRQPVAIAGDATEQPIVVKTAAVADVPNYERGQAALENGGQPPESLVAILGSSKLKHWSYVASVAWTPDGKLLGSAGGDGCLRLWDPDTGEQLKRFKSEPLWAGGAPHLTSLAFEPDGQRVAAGLGTNAVRIWEIETGKETHLLKDDAPIQRVAWHPTRPLLATGGELTARLWDLSTGMIARSLEPQDTSFRRKSMLDVVHVAFAPDGRHLVVAHPDGSIRFWDIETGQVARTIAAHEAAIQALAIEGARDLVATGGPDGKLRLWRLSTGEPIREIAAHERYIQGLAFHPRRDVIYSSGLDGSICSWILRTGDKRLEFAASRSVGPGGLALHPSRDLLASAGNAACLWNASTGRPHIESAGHLGGIQSLALTPDGARLVSAGNDTTMRVWDLSRQVQLASFQGLTMPVKNLSVLPDGKSFIAQYAYQGNIELRTIEGGAVEKSWKAISDLGEAISVSPDGKWIAAMTRSKGTNGELTVCDVASGKVHATFQTHQGHPYFSHDGTRLVVVGTEFQFGANTKAKSRLSVWNVETKEKAFSLEDVQGLGSIQATSLSFDGGTLAIAGTAHDKNEQEHQQLVFWDWTKNETRLVIDLQGHRPNLMAFAPDGRSLVTGAVQKGEARVWDPRDGSLRDAISLCEGNPWSIGALAYTPDSRQIALAMGNGTIYLIQPASAAENVPLKVAVPEPFKEPDPDSWKSLIGQPAPEWQAQGWLFGGPTNVEQLRGRWIVLYFWNFAFSDQDVPALMRVQQHFGKRGPEIIIVKQGHAETVEKEQAYFERLSRESWEGRPLPFRVLIDQREPDVIPATGIKTGGATHAAYRVMQSRRGYVTNPVALLISPEGIVKQAIGNRPSIREVEGATGLLSQTPQSEKTFLREYSLPEGDILRRMPPPYSEAREEYRFFRHGRWDATMTFEQAETLQEKWSTGGNITLEWVLHYVAGFSNYEFVDPDNALDRNVVGDWCIRAGTAREKLLPALERIARNELGWKIRFEPATITRPVIVASGKWGRKALPGVDGQLGIFLTVDDIPNPTLGGGGSGSFDELLRWLGDRLRLRVVGDVVDPPRERIRWQDRLAEHMQEIRNQSSAGKEKLAKLLEKLSHQTGLTFRQEEREVSVWRIVVE